MCSVDFHSRKKKKTLEVKGFPTVLLLSFFKISCFVCSAEEMYTGLEQLEGE